MPEARGSIYISTANEIGQALKGKLGGEGYAPKDWSKNINLLGINSSDTSAALASLKESQGSGDRGSILISSANDIGAMLNKKYNSSRGFMPSEWASATRKMKALIKGTASGGVANISDAAKEVPLTSLVASIEPIQDLHGYSKPWPAGGGNNKLDPSKCTAMSGSYSLTITFNNGTVHISGTSTNTGASVYFNILSYDDYSLSNLGYYVQAFNGRGTGTFKSIYGFRTATEKTIAIGFDFSQNANIDYTFELSVSPISLDSYEPYSNICPISGSTQTIITQEKKNLFNDDEIHNGGVDPDNGEFINTPNSIRSGYIRVGAGDTLTLSYTFAEVSSSADRVIGFYDAGKNFISSITYDPAPNPGLWKTEYTFSVPSGVFYAAITLDDAVSSIVLEKGTERTIGDTYYEAKTPVTIEFDGTIYGGYVDAVTGEGEITYASVTYNGSEDWTAYASGNGYARTVSDMESGTYYNDGMVKCDVFAKQPDNTNLGVRIGVSNSNIYVVQANTLNGVSDVTSFKTWLSNNPITITFPLANPIAFTVDPHEFSTYENINNFYNTTGDTSLEYYKAPTAYGRGTASGAIASFSGANLEYPFTKLKANIAPNLEGVSEVEVFNNGKNLFSSEIESGNINAQGNNEVNNTRCRTKDFIRIPQETLCISYAESNRVGCFFYDENQTFISFLSWQNAPLTFNPPSTARYVRFSFETTIYPTELQLETGSTATAYEAYKTPTTYTANLGTTVYGGSVDLVSGEVIDSNDDTFYIDPQEIYPNEGVNNIWNDANGNTEVAYFEEE